MHYIHSFILGFVFIIAYYNTLRMLYSQYITVVPIRTVATISTILLELVLRSSKFTTQVYTHTYSLHIDISMIFLLVIILTFV